MTDLIHATAVGDTSRVRTLLRQGADPNACGPDGWGPLLAASIAAPRELLALLLEAGADVNARAPDGSTGLMKATLWGRVEAVRLLLECGADPRLADEHGWTPLKIAEQLRNFELKQLLDRPPAV